MTKRFMEPIEPATCWLRIGTTGVYCIPRRLRSTI